MPKTEALKTAATPQQTATQDQANRLQDLEKKIQQLLKELETIRAASATPTSSAQPKIPAPPPVAKPTEPKKEARAAKPSEPPKADEAKKEAVALPSEITFNSNWLHSLTWRSIGPASMGGRIVDIAVVDSDPCCYYVATASGGLFKTTNNGVTFQSLFDHENSVSIGDICIAPSNPDTLWVGTGEHNARNSVSWGDGVYKSSDGGKTWTNMGLKNSYQIGRIAIHPRNPDIVYVGALGRLWGENEDRGVYKTIDGGKTWDKVLHVDAKTGCVDIAMKPDDPETILAAMYERQRGIYDEGDPAKRWGPGSGLFRSVDGGKTWRKTTEGLPTVQMGRIGVKFSQKNPKTLFAIIETEKGGTGPRQQQEGSPALMGIQGEDGTRGAKLTSITAGGSAEIAGLREGDLVVEFEGKAISSYSDLTGRIGEHKSGDKVKLKYERDNMPGELELTFGQRPAGGRGAGPGGGGSATGPYSIGLGGQRENVQDRQGTDGFQTGGIYKSTDSGETWTRINSLNPRPFYYSQIHVDPNDDSQLYVLGVSSFRSRDGGKTFSPDLSRGVHSDHHVLWIDPRDGRHMLLGGDGGLCVSHDRGQTWEHLNIMPIGQFYHVAVDTRRPYRVYGGLQDNGSWGGPSATRGRNGPTNEDWITVGGGDGFVCQVDPNDPDQVYFTSQYGNMGRINVRTSERHSIRPTAEQGKRFRFNWKTPFILSSHNSKIFYAAGNYVFKSLDRGDKLRLISPEITATNKGAASALAESPLNPDVVYVGTDDGAVWITRDGGHEWMNITENIKDVPATGCIASIEPSRFKDSRAYLTIDAHRTDSTAPYVVVTEDFGKTWTSLHANLPDGSAHTLREDLQNQNLLYLGTEFSAWVSLDRGASWHKLNNNLPTVAVHEFALPTTANELVAATHGRSIWVLDITPLRQLTDDVQKAKAHLFKPEPAVVWGGGVGRSLFGHKRYVGDNPSDGAAIHYLLAEKPNEITLKVIDSDGKTIRELPTKKEPGLHRTVWDLRRPAPTGQRSSGSAAGTASTPQGGSQSIESSGTRTSAQGGPPSSGQGPPSLGAARTQPGPYRLVLSVDGKEFTQPLLVETDPQFPASVIVEEKEDDEERELEIEQSTIRDY